MKKIPKVSESYAIRALEYCNDVLSGKIIACEYVKMACQRHINDLAKQSDADYPFIFNPVLWDDNKKKYYRPGERRCSFSESLVHVRGAWRGKYLKLSPHQVFKQVSVWGWVKKSNFKRRFGLVYEELPRKNGKSTDLATGALYALTEDNEPAAEIFSGATTEKQALEVFMTAWLMAKNTPGFLEYYGLSLSGTPKNPTSIYRLSDMSRFEMLIGNPGDGASVHFAAVDEYHEHRTSNQLDTMETGTGAREQAIIYVITTAGDNTSSPCYTMRTEMIKILNGSKEEDTTFVVIYTIDLNDDYKDFEVWKKANPNFGVSIYEDQLRKKYKAALTDVSKQNVNFRKHLNVWTNAGVAWMPMPKWDACKDPSLKIEDFKGKPCYVSIDLASKIDICAKIQLFSDGVQETERETIDLDTGELVMRKTVKEKFAFFCKFYLPEDTVNLVGNDHYANWQKEGLLTVTSGARTDFKFIEDDIKADHKNHPIQELAFDQREAGYLINNIQEWASFECIEVTQSPAMLSQPMKELEALVYDKMIRHDGNKIMTWMIGNVMKKQGRNSGPVKYYYPTKQKDSDKIDGPVALIMAIGQAMLKGVPQESVYSQRGIFVFD